MEKITSNRAKQSTREPDDRTVTPGISSDILSRQTSSLRKSYDDYPLRAMAKSPHNSSKRSILFIADVSHGSFIAGGARKLSGYQV